MTPIYIHNGEPRKIVEPVVGLYYSANVQGVFLADEYQSALLKAWKQGFGFEDSGEIWNFLPDTAFTFTHDDANLIDGLYHVTLPKYREVRQWRTYKEEWKNGSVPKEILNKWGSAETRTIIRIYAKSCVVS